MWELPNVGARVPVAPENFRVESREWPVTEKSIALTGLSFRCADCEGHGLLRPLKNSYFVSGRDFRGCGKTHKSPEGTAEFSPGCNPGLAKLKMSSPVGTAEHACFVSGHDFS